MVAELIVIKCTQGLPMGPDIIETIMNHLQRGPGERFFLSLQRLKLVAQN